MRLGQTTCLSGNLIDILHTFPEFDTLGHQREQRGEIGPPKFGQIRMALLFKQQFGSAVPPGQLFDIFVLLT